MITRLLFLSVTLFAVGCDDDPNEPNGSNNGGSGMTSGSGGTGGGAGSVPTGGTAGANPSGGSGGMLPTCNTLEFGDAPDVGFTYDLGDAPAPLGGQIADGTYFLTQIIAYGIDLGISDPFSRSTLVVSGSTWQVLDGFPSDDDLNPPRHLTYAASTNGTALTLTRSCPSAGMPESGSFTVTPEGFTLYIVDAGYTVGNVFTQQ